MNSGELYEGLKVEPNKDLKNNPNNKVDQYLNVKYGIVKEPYENQDGDVHLIYWYDKNDKLLFEECIAHQYLNKYQVQYSIKKIMSDLEKLESKL